ncbi:efflux transporter outer membrane subunit [Prosthecobacter sp.]|uniref:efflux transporter outer membrane subunit n=1 Tax=Prosthecobacter sp. TaxID=1965333 RepID=UPI002ABB89A2|nr:efflux transporter outer membrane subunit [Prosthecobacter sp.]MDZ4403493.1 efflux transporter outer membrane subunit [Prosthecobacter sp.]
MTNEAPNPMPEAATSFVIRHSAAAVLCLCIAGCAFFPPLGSKRLKTDVAALHGTAPAKWAALPGIPKSAATGWLDEFGSSRLPALVQQAVAANPSLKATAARVEQARAQLMQAGSGLFPALTSSGSASRTQSPGDQRFPGINPIANRFNGNYLNLSWEIDFWGRVADTRRAAKAGSEAAEEDWHAARLSLASTTVQTAVSLAEAESLLALAQSNVTTRKVQLGILERQMDRGIEPERAALDVSLSRADLARAESTVQQRRATADQTRRTLETLLGGYPAGTERGLGSLPSLKRGIPAGLPSEMLLRRPDLRAAERRLASALASESAAKKAMLPSIRLTGSAGRTSQQIEQIIRPESAIWNLGTQVGQTLFQGGLLKAGVDLQRGRYHEILQTYADSVLTAFREVETALAAEQFLLQQESALERAASEAERAEQLALSQYEKGLSEVLTLLDTRQRAFDARSTLTSVKAQRLRNRAALHLALGGEF